jgi:hypothetical protein
MQIGKKNINIKNTYALVNRKKEDAKKNKP